MKFHPYANIFPMIGEDGLIELAESIKQDGLDNPIVIYQDKILDGRNRYRACGMAQVMTDTIQFEGNDEDALKFVWRQNVHRRHLDRGQRSIAAARMANMEVGDNQHNGGSANLHTQSIQQAANDANVSRRSAATAKRLLKEAPEIAQLVEQGNLSLNAADQAIGFDSDAIESVVEAKDPAKEIRKINTRNNPKEPEAPDIKKLSKTILKNVFDLSEKLKDIETKDLIKALPDKAAEDLSFYSAVVVEKLKSI